MSKCWTIVSRPLFSSCNAVRNFSCIVHGNSKIFYNDDLQIFRPFQNTVKLKFNPSASPQDTGGGYLEQPIRSIAERLSKHGEVNGRFICDRGRTGYFNFSRSEEKEDALKTYSVEPTPLFTMEDYRVGQSPDKHEIRPFRYILVASLRPTIHSVSRIVRYLSQFGTNNGFELVKCPYDPDRMFMYYAFADRRALQDPALCPGDQCGSIDGNKVARDYRELERSKRNDVFLFPSLDNTIGVYKPGVLVFSQGAESGQIREFLSYKYGDVAGEVERIQQNEQGLYYRVKFKEKYSVYRLMYQKSFYGRVIETIPGTSEQIYISKLSVHKKAWIRSSIRVRGAPRLPDKEVLSYWNGFLDGIGCNPGLVSVAKNLGFYELYFANPWHTFDVNNRIICSKSSTSDHGLTSYAYTGQNDEVNFYESVKGYLN